MAGIVIGSVSVLRAVTASTIEFLRPIPSVALIPVAVLLYGTDLRSVLLLVGYASFWQVLVQVLAGTQDVDPVAEDTARSYRLGGWGRVRYVMWPTALPYVMTGVRLAATVALVLTITADLVIGAPGLGHEIAIAQTSGAVPQVYALVLVTGLLGVAVNLMARAVERRALHWHPSVRREGCQDVPDDRPQRGKAGPAGAGPARGPVRRVVVRHRRQHRLLRSAAVRHPAEVRGGLDGRAAGVGCPAQSAPARRGLPPGRRHRGRTGSPGRSEPRRTGGPGTGPGAVPGRPPHPCWYR